MTAVCVDNHTVLCYTNASVCTYVRMCTVEAYCILTHTRIHTYVRTYIRTYVCALLLMVWAVVYLLLSSLFYRDTWVSV